MLCLRRVLKEDRTFIVAPDAKNEWEFTPGEKIVVLAVGVDPEKIN